MKIKDQRRKKERKQTKNSKQNRTKTRKLQEKQRKKNEEEKKTKFCMKILKKNREDIFKESKKYSWGKRNVQNFEKNLF